jgi:membrane protein DedA with SNARE-associated domain
MDVLHWILSWLGEHRFAVVFVSSLIDATGLPFPGRVVLLLAGTITSEWAEVWPLIALSTLGSVIGDHALYGAGLLGGRRVMAWYCRLTLASEHCLDKTLRYFKRFGPAAVLLGRFSFGVRLFATILAGAGHLPYSRFLAFDVIGTVVYATLWLGGGHVFGATLMERTETARLLLLGGPLAILAVLVFRYARRRRYGATAGVASRANGEWP